MKRKKLAGKMLSILMAAALTFTSVEVPAYAAEDTGYESLQTEENENDVNAAEEASVGEEEAAGEAGEDAEGAAPVEDSGAQAEEEAEAVSGTDATEDVTEDITEPSEEEIRMPEEKDKSEEAADTSAGSNEADNAADVSASLNEADDAADAAVSENTAAEENRSAVSENVMAEEEQTVYEDAVTGIKAGPYIVYGGKKDVDFTYKEDSTTKVTTLTVLTTTPLVIEAKTGKASVPIVLGNAVSPCDIHVTIRNTSIKMTDTQAVAAISIPLNYTKDVTITFEERVTLQGAANNAAIQKNMTDKGFTKSGYLILEGDTTVKVTGGDGAAAIGSGIITNLDSASKEKPMSGKIIINGNTITATGGKNGAGIGGGNGSSARDITINGGEVTATGKEGGAGIGGGQNGGGNYLCIKGGKVTAKGSKGGAGIGGGTTGEGANISIYGGSIEAVGGTGGAGIGGGSGKSGKDVIIYGTSSLLATGGTGAAGIGGGSKGSGSNLTIHGGRDIIAEGGGTGAGIGGGSTKDGINITINGGKVKAISEKGGAGIGGGKDGKGNDITINNGTVQAIAVKEAKSDVTGAGIGGGANDSASNITIKGGTVQAESGDGAGIGGGKAAAGNNITIEGGTVSASAGADAAGIGSGKGKGSSNIKITGGNVVAENESSSDGHYTLGAGYGGSSSNIYISGGSVDASVDPDCTVTKDELSSEGVTLQIFKNYTPGERISLTDITYADYYNASNLLVDGMGQIYLWLPEGADVNTERFNKNYEVSFVTNCYTSEKAQYVTAGEKIKLPDTEKYTVDQADFEGWYTAEDYAAASKWTDESTVSGNTVLYAKWKHYYVLNYYNSVSGKYYGNEKVYDGNTPKGIADPVRNGYVFTGWYIGSKLYDMSKPLTRNTTVIAGWDRRALAPYVNVPSGEVEEGTYVILKSNTVGATIYYTADESVPSRKALKYLDPIKLTKSMLVNGKITIKAYSVKEGFVDSGYLTYTYTLRDDSHNPGDVLEEDYPDGDVTKIPTEGVWIGGIPKDGYVYTGKAIKPEIRIYDGKTLLKEKKDYTITYKNNINASAASAEGKKPTFVITGKGNYTNKLNPYTFLIAQADIGKDTDNDTYAAEDITVAANGRIQTPKVVLTRNGKKLKENKEYTVDYSSVKASEGDYKVRIQGIGNYCGSREITLHVTTLIQMSKVSVKKIANQNYTGSEIRPEVVVSYKGMPLTNGKDYTLTYTNNLEAGKASVKITAADGSRYKGSKVISFTISGTSMSKVKIDNMPSEITYNGSRQSLSGYRLYVPNGGFILKENEDYTVSYEENQDAGKAVVIFTGKGGYTGVLKKTFKIAPYNLYESEKAHVQINVKEENVYTKGGAEAAVEVFFDGVKLQKGRDYTLSYANNQKVTTKDTIKMPQVTIKGKGNFTGSVNAEFKITKASLSKADFKLEDKPYSNEVGVFKVTPVIKDVNGKELTAGKDYKYGIDKKTKQDSVIYTYYDNVKLGNGEEKVAGSRVGELDIIPAGTEIMVTVYAADNSNYEGSISAKFRIIKKNINTVTVKADSKSYTGSEIMPGKTSIHSTKLSDDDYEIVGYKNNIKKGTGTITIRGVGNYGGTKTVSFKILPKILVPFIPATVTKAEN